MINFTKPYKLFELDNDGNTLSKFISFDINFIPMIRYQHIGNMRVLKIAWLCWGVNIIWKVKRNK